MKFFFSITDTVQWFDFDPTKVDVYIKHRLLEVDQDGNSTVTDTRFDIRKCAASDFNNTDFERNFWDAAGDYYSYGCIDDPNNSLSLKGPGTYDVLE